MGGCPEPRYCTEITRENYFKYRTHYPVAPHSVFYGSDQDMSLKTINGLRAGAIIGAGAGAIMFSFEKGEYYLPRCFERFFRHGLPWVAAGVAYGFTTSLAANVRHKDGALNHILGGLAAGTMIGSSYKSVRLGCFSGVAIAAAGGILKAAIDNDFLPQGPARRPRIFNMYRTGWFTERPDPEGVEDWDKDDAFRNYRP